VRHGKKPLTQWLGVTSTVKIDATRWTIPLPKYTVNRESDNETEIMFFHKYFVYMVLNVREEMALASARPIISDREKVASR
jgi:hypothetical protein